MEGRAIARPNFPFAFSPCLFEVTLQWRAGQLPGQTPGGGVRAVLAVVPSMEGRAIARPNDVCRMDQGSWGITFNGGPGNCPAKRCRFGVRVGRQQRPSMEGRAIARPNSPRSRLPYTLSEFLQWRAGQLPGQTASSVRAAAPRPSLQWRAGQLPGQTMRDREERTDELRLQWRAGQLPGQTCARSRAGSARNSPSMEGRAIARPNRGWQKIVTIKRHWPSMEGRAIARPNVIGGLAGLAVRDPSMEGRAIARPNPAERTFWASMLTPLQWRAGQLPGQTCPARSRGTGPAHPLQWRAGQLPGQTSHIPDHYCLGARPSMEGRAIARPNLTMMGCDDEASPSLQWRAGQLPGQTPPNRKGTMEHKPPSMEGRAIARPNHPDPQPARTHPDPFNGGPGNCPAKPGVDLLSSALNAFLQWRAGQLPGQTAGLPPRTVTSRPLQWRAGQLPGQTGHPRAGYRLCRFCLQWRAGQLPGQT